MFTGMKRSAFLTTLSVMLLVAQAQAQNPARIEMGHKLFQKNCSACHGSEAKGGRGPDLTTGRWKSGSSDADILRNILTGIAGTQMPAFPMPEDEARAIVVWLRSLRSAGPEEQVTGDPHAGRVLFFGSAGCSHCHMFGGQGGRLGPDLGAPVVAAGRGGRGGGAPVNLRQAILNPD